MDAWCWRPPSGDWIGALRGHLANWSPERLPRPVVETTRAALARAIAAQSGWLYHPFVSPLVPGANRALPLDSVQLPAWLALHSDVSFSFRLEAPASLVTATGDVVSLSGEICSRDLAAAIGAPGEAGRPLLPFVGGRASIAGRPREEALIRATERIAARLPRVADWVAEAAKLGGMLQLESDEMFGSASFPEVPGYIALSPGGEVMQVLEAVVHETAHLYFFRCEAAAPLVRPSRRRFVSPLRPDPRPLRGILLAMHACAYVSAAFAEAETEQLEHPERCAAQRRDMLALFDEAYGVVADAADLLTPAGAAFVGRTAAIAEHSSLRAAA